MSCSCSGTPLSRKPMRMQQLLLLLLPLLLSVHIMPTQAQLPRCSTEYQLVMCGQLPFDTPESFAAYVDCCQTFEPRPLPPAAQAARAQAAAAQATAAATIYRPDLDLTAAGRFSGAPNYLWSSTAIVNSKWASTCVARGSAALPTFTVPQQATVNIIAAPLLTSAQIQRTKLKALTTSTSVPRAVRHAALRLTAAARRAAPTASPSSFIHPAGLMGASEMSLMQNRLNASISPQTGALASMLSGKGVPPKFYRTGNMTWNPPVDCPTRWWPGPYAMASVSAKYGGYEESSRNCPSNYPTYAPTNMCGHISFVEMDGQMIYKQALAYHATKDVRYAQNVFTIINAWAGTNKAWGMPPENGPLEAGWGIAAMARALEMLRSLPGFAAARNTFMTWFNTYPQPQMVSFVDVSTANAVKSGNLNVYSNWHATIAEAWMAVAVLSDDSTLFNKATALFTNTVRYYLRWGRAPAYTANRTVGECTETLRDIYHTEFGLGGLLQTAELAWQQNVDLYSSYSFALVAAMELHARIINAWDAGKQEAMLPPGFKFYDTSMPAPPAGTQWSFDITQQLWTARDSSGRVVNTLRDGFKYVLGVNWLPTWEVGYNHYAGRLGILMPETAALISRYPIEHHEFHWGEGTLSHADTAYQLWRGGLSAASLC